MSAKNIVMSAGSSATTSIPAWINKLVGANTDIANAVAVDSSGNVYITGQTQTGTEYDSILAKYTSTGILVWQVKLAAASVSEQGYCIAVDSSSNIYIGGGGASSAGGALLVKYDTNGNIVWQQKYETTGTCSIFGITVDSSGNIYTAGSIYANVGALGNTSSGFVCKYNSSGTIQWQQIFYYNVNANPVHFRGISLDSSANIYVAGETNNDFLIAKLNSSGTVQWKRSINITTQDNFRGITVDSSGNCYAIGYTNTNGYDIIFAKYNTSGVLQWIKALSAGTTYEYGYAICVDSTDNIYITGISATSTTLASQNIVILKYNSAGTLQWQRTLANSTGNNDAGYGIRATATNVFIAGIITQTNSDVFVASLPSDGTKTGTYALGSTSMVYAASSLSESTPSYTEADATTVTVFSYSFGILANNGTNGTGFFDVISDTSDNIYTIGNLAGAADQSVYLGKYSSSGTLLLGKSISTSGNYLIANNIKLDSAGNFIILAINSSTGITILFKINSTGTLVWVRVLNRNFYSRYRNLTIDSSDNIYIAFTDSGSLNFIFKYNSSGTLQWQKQNAASCKFNAITTDSSGNVYVAGAYVTTDYVPFIMKLNSSGTILWQKRHADLLGYYIKDIKVDSSGNIYVIGDGGSLGEKVFAAKYSSTPTLVWLTLGSFNNYGAMSAAINIDSNGNVYLFGDYQTGSAQTTTELFVIKLTSAGANVFGTTIGTAGVVDQAKNATIDSSNILRCAIYQYGSKGCLYSIIEGLIPQTQTIGASSVVISSVNSPLTIDNTSYPITSSALTLATGSAVDSAGSGYTISDYTFPTINFTSNFGGPTIAATSITAGTTSLTSTTVTI